jgi:hypothetical protein
LSARPFRTATPAGNQVVKTSAQGSLPETNPRAGPALASRAKRVSGHEAADARKRANPIVRRRVKARSLSRGIAIARRRSVLATKATAGAWSDLHLARRSQPRRTPRLRRTPELAPGPGSVAVAVFCFAESRESGPSDVARPDQQGHRCCADGPATKAEQEATVRS